MKIANKQYLGKATEYDNFRPKYSDNLTILLHNKLLACADIVGIDVGAGTGIWTRQLFNALRWKELFAIEPCSELLEYGKTLNKSSNLIWRDGVAESLPFESHVADLITVASTFNWLDQEKALQEAWRVLKKDGLICLIWNPIDKNDTPELRITERFLDSLMLPQKNNTNSKKQELANKLSDLLEKSGFTQIEYHTFEDIYQCPLIDMKGFWTYTDKLKYQLNKTEYRIFQDFLNDKFNTHSLTKYTCVTKCWLAKKDAEKNDGKHS